MALPKLPLAEPPMQHIHIAPALMTGEPQIQVVHVVGATILIIPTGITSPAGTHIAPALAAALSGGVASAPPAERLPDAPQDGPAPKTPPREAAPARKAAGHTKAQRARALLDAEGDIERPWRDWPNHLPVAPTHLQEAMKSGELKAHELGCKKGHRTRMVLLSDLVDFLEAAEGKQAVTLSVREPRSRAA